MGITSKRQGNPKSRPSNARNRVQATRLTDLLGDFSEQTGAMFG